MNANAIVKSDIEIALSSGMENIKVIAGRLGIAEDELELYGKYKAKLSSEILEKLKTKTDGKLILSAD